jgi:Ger(x)C family germination protein
MRKFITALLLLSLAFSPGCWDLRILEELALIFGIGVDMGQAQDTTQFTFVHPLFAQEAQDVRITKTITAYSLQQALINLQHQTDELPVVGKVSTFIFSEEVARNGNMHSILTEFDQLRDNNPNAWVCIVRGSEAKEVMNLNIAPQARISIFLTDMFTENQRNGRIPRSDVTTYWTRHYTSGISPVVPVIELTGTGSEKTGVLLAGVGAIDSSGKLKGFLNDAETSMYLLLTKNAMRGRFHTNVDLGQRRNSPVSAFVQRVSVKTKTAMVNDMPLINVKAEIDINDLYVGLGTNAVPSDQDLRQLETSLARDLQGNMLRIIKKTQQWETDIVGFGQHMRANHYDWFQKNNWESEFRKCQITVEVKVNIQRAGSLIKTEFGQ